MTQSTTKNNKSNSLKIMKFRLIFVENASARWTNNTHLGIDDGELHKIQADFAFIVLLGGFYCGLNEQKIRTELYGTLLSARSSQNHKNEP